MPCEFVPRMVNTYISTKLEGGKLEKSTMYEEKCKLNGPATSSCSLEKGSHLRESQKECCQEGFDEKFNPKTFQKELQYQVFGYRTLPRVFSALGDFEAIKETESVIDDVCAVSSKWNSVPHLQESHNSRGKSSSNVTGKTQYDVGWFAYSSPKNNRRRSSEGSLVSAREDRGLGEYRNYSEATLSDRRSERKDSIDILEQKSNTGITRSVNDHSRRSSFAVMNTIPETLSDSQRFYSLPRKLSLPVENRRSTRNGNGKKHSNSLPRTSNISEVTELDNDTDIQWEMLVARARNFQKLSSRERENSLSNLEGTDDMKMKNEPKGFHAQRGDQNAGSMGSSHNEAKGNDEAIQRKKSQENSTQSLESTDTGKNNSKEQSSTYLAEKEIPKSGQIDLTVKKGHCQQDIDIQLQMERNTRRYSLATARPTTEVREKISGYSTHGALEYARMLLGRIQSEGKTKTKKERLEEMSKALKMVLEELNRIDHPDRELVSLFVSLRAKIVNLRAELKAEEKQELTNKDKEKKDDDRVMSRTLPRARSTSESIITQPNFRRFSWC